MKTIKIYFGPEVRAEHLRSSCEYVDLFSGLMHAVSQPMGHDFQEEREFLKQTRLELYWTPLNETRASCDATIQVREDLVDKVISAINTLKGYSAKKSV